MPLRYNDRSKNKLQSLRVRRKYLNRHTSSGGGFRGQSTHGWWTPPTGQSGSRLRHIEKKKGVQQDTAIQLQNGWIDCEIFRDDTYFADLNGYTIDDNNIPDWQCTQCTYFNTGIQKSSFCSMCNHALDYNYHNNNGNLGNNETLMIKKSSHKQRMNRIKRRKRKKRRQRKAAAKREKALTLTLKPKKYSKYIAEEMNPKLQMHFWNLLKYKKEFDAEKVMHFDDLPKHIERYNAKGKGGGIRYQNIYYYTLIVIHWIHNEGVSDLYFSKELIYLIAKHYLSLSFEWKINRFQDSTISYSHENLVISNLGHKGYEICIANNLVISNDKYKWYEFEIRIESDLDVMYNYKQSKLSIGLIQSPIEESIKFWKGYALGIKNWDKQCGVLLKQDLDTRRKRNPTSYFVVYGDHNNASSDDEIYIQSEAASNRIFDIIPPDSANSANSESDNNGDGDSHNLSQYIDDKKKQETKTKKIRKKPRVLTPENIYMLQRGIRFKRGDIIGIRIDFKTKWVSLSFNGYLVDHIKRIKNQDKFIPAVSLYNIAVSVTRCKARLKST